MANRPFKDTIVLGVSDERTRLEIAERVEARFNELMAGLQSAHEGLSYTLAAGLSAHEGLSSTLAAGLSAHEGLSYTLNWAL